MCPEIISGGYPAVCQGVDKGTRCLEVFSKLEAFSSLEAVTGLLLRPGFRMHHKVAWLGLDHTEAGALHLDWAQHLSDLQKTLGARSGTRVANIREIEHLALLHFCLRAGFL